MTSPADEPADLCRRLGARDPAALAEAFAFHRPRLLQAVRLRLHPRLATRLDPDDVLQETFLDAEKRLASFDPAKAQSSWVWLRLVLGQTLADLHRRHLVAKARDAQQEKQLGGTPGGDTSGLSSQFVAHLTSPSGAAMRAEVQEQVRNALDAMEPIDRELLTLRHFEDATNAEIAALLDIPESTASGRYLRALKRLRSALRPHGDGDG